MLEDLQVGESAEEENKMNTVACIRNAAGQTSIIETYLGLRFDLLNPDPKAVHIEDIAHHLSLENRYNGATRIPLSVAQHCILVSEQFTDFGEQAFALLHDAHEAYCKDITRPLKTILTGYAAIADGIQQTIQSTLLPAELLGRIDGEYLHRLKTADDAVCRAEAAFLMRSRGESWGWNGTPILQLNIEPMTPAIAEVAFLGAWGKLWQ